MKHLLFLVVSLSALASAVRVHIYAATVIHPPLNEGIFGMVVTNSPHLQASQVKRGSNHRRGYCASAITYGTCTPGVQKYGAYHYKNHCRQTVDLAASDYVVESVHKGISFDACVLGCSHDAICCAVNYEICGSRCQYLARTDGTDFCYKTPIIFTDSKPGFESSGIIPPSEVPGSIYGGN